jgi:hypothetical protein
MELWDAVDYLIRTAQAKKAVPYLDRFMKSRPDDATWIAIRDRFGLGSLMRLDEDPATRPFAQPAAEAFAAAARRHATNPQRIAQFIHELTGTPEEQDYALRRLREAGPYAVPPLVEALRRPGLSAQERGLLVRNIGRLDQHGGPAPDRRAGLPRAGIGGSRSECSGEHRRPGGPAILDLPGQCLWGSTRRAHSRTRGDRPDHGPPIRRPAAFTGAGPDLHSLAVPSPPGGAPGRAGGRLGVG